MSGGSFDYLYSKSLSNNWLDSETDTQSLEEMADYLEENHKGTQAAVRTRSLLDRVTMLKRMIEGLEQELYSESSDLNKVWKAAEYYNSQDTNEDQLLIEISNLEQS